MYRTTQRFYDLEDDRHLYQAGDEYPRKGHNPTRARIEELSTDRNKMHTPLIEEVKKPKQTKKKEEAEE